MTFNYAPLRSTTDTMLREYGQVVTFLSRSIGDYDPETGEAAVTEAEHSGAAVPLDYGTKNIDGSLVKVGDKQLLLSPVGIPTPKVGDGVVIQGITYSLTIVKEVGPGGLTVLFDCNIRP